MLSGETCKGGNEEEEKGKIRATILLWVKSSPDLIHREDFGTVAALHQRGCLLVAFHNQSLAVDFLMGVHVQG